MPIDAIVLLREIDAGLTLLWFATVVMALRAIIRSVAYAIATAGPELRAWRTGDPAARSGMFRDHRHQPFGSIPPGGVPQLATQVVP